MTKRWILFLALAVSVTGCSGSSDVDTSTTIVVTTTKAESTPATTTTALTTTTTDDVGPRARRVTAADYGDEWPLTVDSGIISCPEGTAVVFDDGTTTYAINGSALTVMDARGWQDIGESEIWADDDSGLGLSKNIGPLLDAGLELCD